MSDTGDMVNMAGFLFSALEDTPPRDGSGLSITTSPSSIASPLPATNTLRVFRPPASFRVVMSLTR